MIVTKERYEELKKVLTPDELEKFILPKPVKFKVDLADTSISTCHVDEIFDVDYSDSAYHYIFENTNNKYVLPLTFTNLKDAQAFAKVVISE